MIQRLGLVVSLVGSSLAYADAPKPPAAPEIKVAIVPGIAVNLDAARVDALAQDMAEALHAELMVDAVGGLEVRRQLPAEGLAPDCVAQPKCVADVAQRLGAQQLLFVVMIDTGTGGAIQVDTTWVDPTAHKTMSRPAVDIAAVADAKTRFISAAHQLLPDAAVRPKPKASLGKMSDPIPRHFTTWTYAAIGATGVGLGVGITLGLIARGKYNDCEKVALTPMPCSQSKTDSIRNVALGADLGWITAVGGTIAAAVLYATSGEESHVIVEPMANGLAVSAVGRF